MVTNRKLIKEEAEARTAAERARYEAAAATASCEHAVQDRQLLEDRLQVVQQRAKEADAAREQSAKQLRVRGLLPFLQCCYFFSFPRTTTCRFSRGLLASAMPQLPTSCMISMVDPDCNTDCPIRDS